MHKLLSKQCYYTPDVLNTQAMFDVEMNGSQIVLNFTIEHDFAISYVTPSLLINNFVTRGFFLLLQYLAALIHFHCIIS